MTGKRDPVAAARALGRQRNANPDLSVLVVQGCLHGMTVAGVLKSNSEATGSS